PRPARAWRSGCNCTREGHTGTGLGVGIEGLRCAACGVSCGHRARAENGSMSMLWVNWGPQVPYGLMSGPPGAGKSLLAACLPAILPPLTPAEALEVSMVASVAGTLEGGRISRTRPFRAPHHSASMAALTGGGLKVRPGEVSLAHLGVLFLDELPEFHSIMAQRGPTKRMIFL